MVDGAISESKHKEKGLAPKADTEKLVEQDFMYQKMVGVKRTKVYVCFYTE